MRAHYLSVVDLFLKGSLELLSSRVDEVYLYFPEASFKKGDIGVVLLVDARDWEEEKALRELILDIFRQKNVLIDLIVVERAKWERWRELNKPIVKEVEKGELIYSRTQGIGKV